MMEELEPQPPYNLTHRHLWAMGFKKEERDRIIKTSKEMWPNDPIALGEFLARSSLTAVQCVNLELPHYPWWKRLWWRLGDLAGVKVL